MGVLRGIVAQITKAPPAPCILGIVTAAMLRDGRYPEALWSCGGVELRADGVPPESVAAVVADFDAEKSRRGFKGPVIFTLRLRRDGGAWDDAASAARNAVWESLPPGTCDWVDLEVEELDRIAPETLDSLRSSGVKLLLSHHAFAPEPPETWERHLKSMRTFGPDGVKFAVAVTADQVPELLEFARRVGAEYAASCVLGLGAAGAATRLLGPLLGCPFTYGYLGNGPVAPGQWGVETMKAFFEAASNAADRPAVDAPVEVWLKWREALSATLNRKVMGD
jgi:3-dehydroquinate dehydratase type I